MALPRLASRVGESVADTANGLEPRWTLVAVKLAAKSRSCLVNSSSLQTLAWPNGVLDFSACVNPVWVADEQLQQASLDGTQSQSAYSSVVLNGRTQLLRVESKWTQAKRARSEMRSDVQYSRHRIDENMSPKRLDNA